MRIKHWLIGLLALAALVIGLGSATAFAQESEGEPARLGLFARVANILGLEEQQVQDAFAQARQELRDEQFEEMVGRRLDALVESERITQEQADDLRAWYASRPDSFWLANGMGRGKDGHGKRDHMDGRRGFSSKGLGGKMHARADERFEQHLSALVQRGQITQEQADQVREGFGTHMRQFNHRGFDRGKGSSWQRSHRSSHQRGLFHFRNFSPMKDWNIPATPVVPDAATPETTPTPADSSDSN